MQVSLGYNGLHAGDMAAASVRASHVGQLQAVEVMLGGQTTTPWSKWHLFKASVEERGSGKKYAPPLLGHSCNMVEHAARL
jgi:hypothetical protein